MTRQISMPAEMQKNKMPRPNPAAAAAAGPSITIGDIKRIILSRMLMIFLITTFMTASSIGLWYYLKNNYPRYESEGYIECKMPAVPGMRYVAEQTAIIEMEASTQANAMNNKGFLSRVLQDPTVIKTNWFDKRNTQERVEDIEDNFRASPLRNTKYVRITMQAEDPREAKIIVDAARTVFEEEKTSEATSQLDAQHEAIKKERDNTYNMLKSARTNLENLGKEADEVAPGWREGRTAIQNRMTLMTREKMVLQAGLADAQAQQVQLQKVGGHSIAVAQAVDNDPQIVAFKNQITGSNQARNQLLERAGQKHLEVEAIDSIIKTAEIQLANRSEELVQTYTQQETQGLQMQVESLKGKIELVDTDLVGLSTAQMNLDKKRREYEKMQVDLDDLVRRIAKKDEEIASINQLRSDPSRLRVRFIAEGAGTLALPSEISFPKLSMFLPAGIILGLMLSIGLAFLLEFVDDSIKSPAEVMRHLRVPMLGMVPEYDQSASGDVCVETIASTHSNALISEYYRQIKTNLFFSAPAGELKTILVTSSSAGCGKTTSTSNLGITFASAGKRVLLVDANFRRPALGRLYPPDKEKKGLSNLLIGQTSASEIIYPTKIAHMDMVQSGPLPPNPFDLLNNQLMRDFLSEQRKKYDYVIIDGPPTLVVIDSRVISSIVDGTVVVVNANQNSRGMVQRMTRELRTGSGKILGILLNSVQPRKGGYFAKTSQSYYDYIDKKADMMTGPQDTASSDMQPVG